MEHNLFREVEQPNRLKAPIRNHYFYGKLLTERTLRIEQAYFSRKDWLVNRLGLGSGILCGLEVELDEDRGSLRIGAGVAIDPYGREIIVPEPYVVDDPRRLERCSSEDRRAGLYHLCLAYHECGIEPVPVQNDTCDPQQACQHSLIRESFRLYLCRVEEEIPPGLPEEACNRIFGGEASGAGRYEAACHTLGGPCSDETSDCVVLASLALRGSARPQLAATCLARRMVYSNAELLDLLFCLADRVDACCETTTPPVLLTLRYISGDGQSAGPDERLNKPLIVRVQDTNGIPAPNQRVAFRVRSGGGLVGDGTVMDHGFEMDSQPDGTAGALWQLGPSEGLQTVEATLATGASVLFIAMAIRKVDDTEILPVITQITPAHASLLDQNALIAINETGMSLRFSQTMLGGSLANSIDWLGVWLVDPHIEVLTHVPPITVIRLELNLLEPQAGADGDFARYKVGLPSGMTTKDLENKGMALLVVVRSEGKITNTGNVFLDAEFAGTGLDFFQQGLVLHDPALTVADGLWGLVPNHGAQFHRGLMAQLAPSPTPLPAAGSGDGAPGGLFHTVWIIQ